MTRSEFIFNKYAQNLGSVSPYGTINQTGSGEIARLIAQQREDAAIAQKNLAYMQSKTDPQVVNEALNIARANAAVQESKASIKPTSIRQQLLEKFVPTNLPQVFRDRLIAERLGTTAAPAAPAIRPIPSASSSISDGADILAKMINAGNWSGAANFYGLKDASGISDIASLQKKLTGNKAKYFSSFLSNNPGLQKQLASLNELKPLDIKPLISLDPTTVKVENNDPKDNIVQELMYGIK